MCRILCAELALKSLSLWLSMMNGQPFIIDSMFKVDFEGSNRVMHRSFRRAFGLVGTVWLMNLSISVSCHGQGAATGGTAVPAKPLPAGMKPPTVRYQDVAAEAGVIG